jgi:predicted ABC-type ATPase
MRAHVPRLRVIAGPNGSGKSVLKSHLEPGWIGVYVNADEIELALRGRDGLNLPALSLGADAAAIAECVQTHSLRPRAGAGLIAAHSTRLTITAGDVNSYHAAAVADCIRRQLVRNRESFTFETVMSSADKIDLLRQAGREGFRTYLYYVATEDPEINVQRVAYRVSQGGHDVPRDRVVERYHRSLANLLDAIRAVDRAYIFDNSGRECLWVAEATNGSTLKVMASRVPGWFEQAVLSKVALSNG